MSLFMVVSQRMFPEDGVLSQPPGQYGGIARKGRIAHSVVWSEDLHLILGASTPTTDTWSPVC